MNCQNDVTIYLMNILQNSKKKRLDISNEFSIEKELVFGKTSFADSVKYFWVYVNIKIMSNMKPHTISRKWSVPQLCEKTIYFKISYPAVRLAAVIKTLDKIANKGCLSWAFDKTETF